VNLKRTRKIIFTHQPLALRQRQAKTLNTNPIADSLLNYQRKAILNNMIDPDGIDLFSIANLDISSQYMYGINFDLVAEIKNLDARLTRFSPDDPRQKHLASVFGHSKIIDSDLQGADFSFCPMDFLFIENSNLKKSFFNQVNFKNSSFKKSILKWANFKKANLVSSCFQATDLQGVNFKGARIFGDSPQVINRRRRQMFSGDSYLGGVVFYKACLYLLVFEEQLLQNVSFKNSFLREVDFRNVIFKNVHFGGANLKMF